MDGSALNSGTIGLVALPLAHIFGLNSVLDVLLRVGATAVLMDRFDVVGAAALVSEHRVNVISAVPPDVAFVHLGGHFRTTRSRT